MFLKVKKLFSRLYFFALMCITSGQSSDNFYFIAQQLLEHRKVDINLCCGKMNNSGEVKQTALEFLCSCKDLNFKAIQLLLNSQNCDINKGDHAPLFHVLCKIRENNDVYFKLASKMFEHPKIDVNAKSGKGTIFSELCAVKCQSHIWINLLLRNRRLNVSAHNATPLCNAINGIKHKNDYFHRVFLMIVNQETVNINETNITSMFTFETPLLCALRKIKTKNDVMYEISCLLLQNPKLDFTVQHWGTVLSALCGSVCPSIFGIELLLSDQRCDVNMGNPPPILKVLSQEILVGNYFHEVLILLLQNNQIDLNFWSKCDAGSLLSMCKAVKQSKIGIELVLRHKNFVNARNGTPEFFAARHGNSEMLKLLCDDVIRDDVRHAIYAIENGNFTDLIQCLNIYSAGCDFTCSEGPLGLLQYYLEIGANPSELLFHAVINGSTREVELLLKHGANPNFKLEIETKVYDPLPCKDVLRLFKTLQEKFPESVYHAALRIGSLQKQQILRNYSKRLLGIDLRDTNWLGDSYLKIKEKYAIKTNSNTGDDVLLERIVNCRKFMQDPETKEIFCKVNELFNQISKRVSKDFHAKIRVSLDGSFRENTKCFAPDEFDFIFVLENYRKDSFENICHFSRACYNFLDILIRNGDSDVTSSDQRLTTKALLHEKKIAIVHLHWKGEIGQKYENLDIFCDLAICNKTETEVAKFSRYLPLERAKPKKTCHINEKYMIRKLSPVIRNGLILAKALRISVKNYQNPQITEVSLSGDKVLTSFLLKSVLFENSKPSRKIQNCKTAFEVAKTIYEKAKVKLETKNSLRCYYSEESVFICYKKKV